MRTMWGRRLFLWVCALSARANIIGPRFLYWHGGRYMTASATTNTTHNAVLLFHATTSQRRACACTSPVRTSRDTIPELLLGSSPPGPRSLSTTITTGASLFSRPRSLPFLAPPAPSRDASVLLHLCGGSLGRLSRLYFSASSWPKTPHRQRPFTSFQRPGLCASTILASLPR